MSLFPAYNDDTKETGEKVRKVIYRIVLSADIKIFNIINVIKVFFSPKGSKARAIKRGMNFMIFIFSFVKTVFSTILYTIFPYG